MSGNEAFFCLPDDVKIAVMMNETKGALQEHGRLNAMGLNT